MRLHISGTSGSLYAETETRRCGNSNCQQLNISGHTNKHQNILKLRSDKTYQQLNVTELESSIAYQQLNVTELDSDNTYLQLI